MVPRWLAPDTVGRHLGDTNFYASALNGIVKGEPRRVRAVSMEP